MADKIQWWMGAGSPQAVHWRILILFFSHSLSLASLSLSMFVHSCPYYCDCDKEKDTVVRTDVANWARVSTGLIKNIDGM